MAGSRAESPDAPRAPGAESAEECADAAARATRRAARECWPVRKFRLEDAPGPDLSTSTTADERLAMMWPLAHEAWTLAGRTMPDYPRHRMPIRVIRPAGGGPVD